MKIFGFQFPFDKQQEREEEAKKSFAPPQFDDGAINIENARGIGGSQFQGQFVDLDGSYKTDTDLIVRYRSLSVHPEIDTAIEEITNEAIVTDEVEEPVKLILDNIDYTESTKSKIHTEFDTILGLLEFRTKGYDYFRRWYIDARCYFHTIIDEANPGDGIKEIRYIDPLNMKKVREIERKQDTKTGVEVVTVKNEFYVYNRTLADTSNPQVNRGTGISISGVRISPDVIVYVTSGLYDPQKKLVYGYLHKAIRTLNQLKMMEDAVVIYRLARAPERRAFYVDVGNLPKPKAEQYMKELINRYRNKLNYDANTGEIRDDRRYLSVLEDYWLPRREGSKGTEIVTLPGACLSMDTKVPLLDGRELTIRQITEEFNTGKKLWAYSCDPITGAIVPGIITWAGVTQKSAKVMKLTLDNGESIVCTPDHKFPIYGKGFVRADQLTINSSLIPFYKKKEYISTNKKQDYEMIFDNADKQWKYTHRMVSEFLKNDCVNDYTYNEMYSTFNKNVVHHKDHNRFNNDPSNLCYMSWKDHQEYHSDHSFGIENAILGGKATKLKLEDMRKNNPKEYAEHIRKISLASSSMWNEMSPEERTSRSKSISTGICKYFDNLSPEEKEIRNKIATENAKKATEALQLKIQDPEYNAKYREIRKNCWTEDMKALASSRSTEANLSRWNNDGDRLREQHKAKQKVILDNDIICFIIDCVKGKTTHEVTLKDVISQLNSNNVMLDKLRSLNEGKSVPNWSIDEGFTFNIVRRAITDFGYDSWKDFRVKESLHNHRIVSIEYMDNEIEVGTLTIDGNEVYHGHHTFALSAGVFTKNSNIGQMEDINYFLRKLSKALNIPYSRIENEQKSFQIGRSVEISRDEIKFAKFIERLRTKFSELFYQLLKKQLILKGIISEDDWDEFKRKVHFHFSHDMYFSELKELEVETERLNALMMIEPFIGTFYSKAWVRKNVLRQNDHDMELMDLEIKEESIKDEEEQLEQEERDDMFGGGNDFGNQQPPNPFDQNPQEEPYDGYEEEEDPGIKPQIKPEFSPTINKQGNKRGNFPRL